MPEKIKLWTRQHEAVERVIEDKGVYRVLGAYIEQKMGNVSPYYKSLYSWYVKRAEKIVPRPSPSVLYPIWFSLDDTLMLRPTAHHIIIEVEVPKSLAIITDQEKWGYVVNYMYLPLNKEDEERHNQELEKLGIGDETAIVMGSLGNFYPLLKRKISASWERLFEPYSLSDLKQATLWEIKQEWVTRITHYEGKV